MRHAVCVFFIATLLSLSTGCSNKENNPYVPWPSTGDTISVVFQDGVSPFTDYHGTRDAILKDSPSSDYLNYNYGIAPIDTIGFARIAGSLYERRLIISFDLSAIKNCSQVIEARLHLSLEPITQNELILGAYSVSMPDWPAGSWPEGTGGLANGVSWLTIDGAELWKNPGGDFHRVPLDTSFVLNNSKAVFELPDSLVLNWIKSPKANHGVIIKPLPTTSENTRLINMRENSTLTLRPSLEVTYLKGG